MDFWQFFWLVVWSFLFIAYLMVLFNILADIFRDHGMSGWVKAVWIIFLILIPVLTALVYLIARGNSMAERQYAQVKQAQADADSYIRQVSSSKSPAEEIASAKSLLDSGTITQAEFDSIKAKALSA
ncbi:SHOCT domain-containing protein [Luteimicrobium subarcticum]|uniref:Phospholipase D-like protein n=1 Tax=Luteimicrobium subarcticum TaxID=620910 RepID=A0A2M8WRN3_9MICO|nr:SHOCT domain-containing protein [Luteimicrobium subarcticum]PJI93603.1 phospholipase D-like protein [Luteimicrobium subarcticum]